MQTEFAIPIPLAVWQDPIGDVVLHGSRKGCVIYFGCWTEAGEPAEFICKLTFSHAWAVKGVNSEFLPYKHKGHHPHSCIYKVADSEWIKQESEQRSRTYPEWKQWDFRIYHHYVVQGHDNYYEVIAASFDEQVISRSEAGELAWLIDEA